MHKVYDFPKSREAFAHACEVIPSGIYGHQGPAEGCYIPIEAFPLYSQKAQGSYLWDLDGNRFIDYMCAYGPNILGYNDPDVDEAAARQRAISDCYLGDTLTFICQAADDLTPRNPSTAYDIVIRKNVGAKGKPEGESIIQAKVSWM